MRPLHELAELLGSERFRRQTLADGSGVMLDLDAMRVLSLNRTGMLVLDALAEGEVRVEGLERRLTETFDVDSETATRDVGRLLDEIDRLVTGSTSA